MLREKPTRFRLVLEPCRPTEGTLAGIFKFKRENSTQHKWPTAAGRIGLETLQRGVKSKYEELLRVRTT